MTTFYTTPCLLCRSNTGCISQFICHDCQSDWPKNAFSCEKCASPLPYKGDICGHCIKQPPIWNQTICSGNYSGSISWLTKQFKYQGKFSAGLVLSHRLEQEILQRNHQLPDALVPMPLHWSRHWKRGYNQATLIADQLSKSLKIPVIRRGITRNRATPALEGLNRKQRRTIMKGAFQTRRLDINHVAIVDDVLTTGASAESLAQSLKHSGVNRVDLWVVARTE